MIDRFNELLKIFEKSRNLDPSTRQKITALRKEIEEDELAVKYYYPYTLANPPPGVKKPPKPEPVASITIQKGD